MKKYVMAAAFASGSLVPPNLPESEAVKHLASYFSPAPGTLVQVDQYEVQNIKKGQDPMALRGFVQVTPPKGKCFIIQKHPDLPDTTVCEKKVLSFTMRELDVGGQLKWKVFTGTDDFGTELTWKSPHRLAQSIPLGEFKNQLGDYVPVLSCEMMRRAGQRRIVLTLMTGEPWIINFPDTDKLTEQPAEGPNLFIRVAKKNPFEEAKKEAGDGHGKPEGEGHEKAEGHEAAAKEGHDAAAKEGHEATAGAKEGHGDAAKEEKPKEGGHGEPPAEAAKEEPAEGHGESAKATSVFVKKEEKDPGYPWNVSPRGAYEMSSSQFLTDGIPFGLKGMCRYKFTGAPNDPNSGILECHDADRYDALLVHLACSASLGPNPK
ncbi:MAG: hypothetical protein AB7T49_17035 [Oligoflexales bacterium]